MVLDKIKSVYIHIPFCKNICAYCDFCKLFYNDSLVDRYLAILEKEVKTRYKNELIKTVYVGGGSPSCLNSKQLKKLFDIIKIFRLDKDIEFTFECNISNLNKRLLQILKDNGVNRLSIGVESFQKKILDNIGRKEIPSFKKINLAKEYFDNINIDLIFGSNNEKFLDLKKDLDCFLKLDVKHISIYSLIIEDKTILKINNYVESSSDLNRKMYDYIRKVLSCNGYIQYEISNFCKKGYQSRHNLTYWNNNMYYGFGLSSSGFIDNNYRYTNTRSMKKYLNGEYVSFDERLSLNELMENEMILSLRKIRGISKKVFYDKYGKNIKEVFDVRYLKENKNYFYIPKKYLYVSNYILSDFVDLENK